MPIHSHSNEDTPLGEGVARVIKAAATWHPPAAIGKTVNAIARNPTARKVAVGAIGGGILGHKVAQAVDKNLPGGQHLTPGAKRRWAGSGALAGAAAGAGVAIAEKVREWVNAQISPALLEEVVVSLLNESVDRIHKIYCEDAHSEFIQHTPGHTLVSPTLPSAIKAKNPNVTGSDIEVTTNSGEHIPIGYVDSKGKFHYPTIHLDPHRLPEASMKESLTLPMISMPTFSMRVKKRLEEEIPKRSSAKIESNLKEEGGKKWQQNATPPSHKGRMHRALGIPMDQKIPTSLLKKKTKSDDPHMRKMANLALRYRGQ